MNQEFPSKYLSADDLEGKRVQATISHIPTEEVFSKQMNTKSQRMVVYFNGKEKGVILSKGRTSDLVSMFGDNPQNAVGKAVTLVARFEQGKNQIRFEPANGNGQHTIVAEEELPTINAYEQ